MAVNIPSALINFEVYDSESKRLLGSSDIELPEISFMTAELQGAGVLGKTEHPIMGAVENLTLKITWRVLDGASIKLLANQTQDLMICGAVQVHNATKGTMGVKAVKVECSGLIKSSSLGKFEGAAKTDTTTELNLDYLKITIDSTEVLEFDRFNYKYTVGAYDYLDKVRDALGFD